MHSPSSRERKAADTEPSSDVAKNAGFLVYKIPHYRYKSLVFDVRVATDWDKALPVMDESKKEEILNKLVQHLSSKKFIKSLSDSQQKWYLHLYLARVIFIDGKLMGWFASTGFSVFENYELIPFEISLDQIAEMNQSPAVKRDDAFGKDRTPWDQFAVKDKIARAAINKAADQELAKFAEKLPLRVNAAVNPKWGEMLAHLNFDARQNLLKKLLFAVVVADEKQNKTEGIFLVNLYIYRVTFNGEAYKVWYADASQQPPAHKELEVTGEKLEQVTRMLDASKISRSYRIDYREEKTADQRYAASNEALQGLIEHDKEVSAWKKFNVDFYEALLPPLIDRRNVLKEFERAYKTTKNMEAEVTEQLGETKQADVKDGSIQQILREDQEIRQLRFTLPSLTTEINASIAAEYKELFEREEKLRVETAHQYATLHHDVRRDKSNSAFIDALTVPLALAIRTFIPEFLQSVKDVTLNLVERAKSTSLKDKKAAKLKEFAELYQGIIGLDTTLNVDALDEKGMREVAEKLSKQILEAKDWEVVLGKINMILGKTSIIFKTEAEKFADMLKELLNPMLEDQNAPYKLLPGKMLKSDALVQSYDNMVVLLAQQRKEEFERRKKEFAASLQQLAVGEQQIKVKLTSYRQQIQTLNDKINAKVLEYEKAKKEKELNEQKRMRALHDSIKPELKLIADELKGHIDYITNYFQAKSGTKDVAKMQAGYELLAELKEINATITAVPDPNASSSDLETNLVNIHAAVKKIKDVFETANTKMAGEHKELSRGSVSTRTKDKSLKQPVIDFLYNSSETAGAVLCANVLAELSLKLESIFNVPGRQKEQRARRKAGHF